METQEKPRCPVCDTPNGEHSYDCATLWRKRRTNRDTTYTEKESCGSCMFCVTPAGISDYALAEGARRCGLPITDHDDETLPNRGSKIVHLNGHCAEYRPQNDSRRMDRPWGTYPLEYLFFNDDTGKINPLPNQNPVKEEIKV